MTSDLVVVTVTAADGQWLTGFVVFPATASPAYAAWVDEAR